MIVNRTKYLKALLANKYKMLEHAPAGRIRFVRQKNHYKYYVSKPSENVIDEYIHVCEKERIRSLLQKKYDERIIRLLELECMNLKKYIEGTENIQECVRAEYSNLPDAIKQYISPVDMSDEDYAAWWLSVPYDSKIDYDDEKKFKTDKDEYVRSKSELVIANELHKRGIPYKYECPLKLKNGAIIYPDFTCLDVKKRRIYLWEHRGMMDDRSYANHSVRRNSDYLKSGFCLGKNLIITEETSSLPLTTDIIEMTIDSYFGF